MKSCSNCTLLIAVVLMCSCGQTASEKFIHWDEIKNEIELELNANILGKWYPVILDTVEGGYLSNLSFDFQPLENQNKMIVTQARHMWTTAMVAKRHSDQRFLKYASHGLPFLQKMWDIQYGGFYQNVDRSGNPLDTIKTAYGNAFAIYGLSAYYDASGDTAALNLARKTFLWLEAHSHDAVDLGYFQILNRKGNVVPSGTATQGFSPAGLKDQNSSIHLLEAFTALYQVWPDELVKERLQEMYHLVKDVMINDRHHLDLFFQPDWTPISYYGQDRQTILQNASLDHVSFGHDIETAFLLLEASEVLGIAHNQKLLDELKLIVDHATIGIDRLNGGLFDQGYYFDRDKPLEIIKDTKAWWAQAEALNTFLIFYHFYPEAGYDQQFVSMWEYIKKYIIDPEHGGWYFDGLDTMPDAKDASKASIWKSTYHNYRALANILEMLEDGHQ